MLSHNRPAPLLLRPHSNTPPCLPLGALTAGRQDAAPHRQRGARLLRHHAHPRLHRNFPQVVMVSSACAALLSIVWRRVHKSGCPPTQTAPAAPCLLLYPQSRPPPPSPSSSTTLSDTAPLAHSPLATFYPDSRKHSSHNNTFLAAVNCTVDARGLLCTHFHSQAYCSCKVRLPWSHQRAGCAAPAPMTAAAQG